MNTKSMKSLTKKIDVTVLTPVILLLVLMLVYGIFANNFFTGDNFLNIFRQVAITGIMAVGVTLVILVGEIDLSIGTVMAFSGMIVAGLCTGSFFGWQPIAVFPAILITLGIGALIGFVSGFACAKIGIPGFMATLAMQYACEGLMLMLTDAKPIGNLPSQLTYWGSGYVFGVIPTLVIVFLIIFVIGFLLLKYTVFGRNLYAIGGNSESSRMAGIKVVRNKTMAFVVCSICCALAGVLMDGRIGSAQVTSGASLQMQPIAGAVLGGASLMGGKGTMVGTLLGVLTMGILVNGLNLMGVGSDAQKLVTGIVLFVAVAFNVWSGRKTK